jgi:hypothetical protein
MSCARASGLCPGKVRVARFRLSRCAGAWANRQRVRTAEGLDEARRGHRLPSLPREARGGWPAQPAGWGPTSEPQRPHRGCPQIQPPPEDRCRSAPRPSTSPRRGGWAPCARHAPSLPREARGGWPAQPGGWGWHKNTYPRSPNSTDNARQLRPRRGALMRRLQRGAECGARGLGFRSPAPGVPSRSPSAGITTGCGHRPP